MVLQAEEGQLTTSSPRILVATAVPVERDAVARAFPEPAAELSRPGTVLHRLPDGGPDLLAAGVGPALAAASTAAALTAAALDGAPYALVVSAGIGGGFLPDAPLGSRVGAPEITPPAQGAAPPPRGPPGTPPRV
ncbi:futalosine hydrolase, partial [Streptomyces olivaceus]